MFPIASYRLFMLFPHSYLMTRIASQGGAKCNIYVLSVIFLVPLQYLPWYQYSTTVVSLQYNEYFFALHYTECIFYFSNFFNFFLWYFYHDHTIIFFFMFSWIFVENKIIFSFFYKKSLFHQFRKP